MSLGTSAVTGRHTCVVLPFPPTVNNLFVNSRRTGGRFPSTAYKTWQIEAARALAAQPVQPTRDGPVRLTFHFGRPDKRKRDIFNYVKAPEDMLVKHGLIADDSLVVEGRVLWSDDVTGVMIEIEDAA